MKITKQNEIRYKITKKFSFIQYYSFYIFFLEFKIK